MLYCFIELLDCVIRYHRTRLSFIINQDISSVRVLMLGVSAYGFLYRVANLLFIFLHFYRIYSSLFTPLVFIPPTRPQALLPTLHLHLLQAPDASVSAFHAMFPPHCGAKLTHTAQFLYFRPVDTFIPLRFLLFFPLTTYRYP